MPRPKITFKTTVLDMELDNVEITVGPEILKVGRLKASLDVADLLRVQLPELMRGDGTMGVLLMNEGQMKIQCIKEVRNITRWGLKEAKEFVETAPILLKVEDMVFFPGAKDLTARNEEAARLLENAGATVEICQGTARIPTVLDRLREMLVKALSAERVQVSDEDTDR